MQSKDAAVHAIKKLEALCIEAGIQQVATYHMIEAELRSTEELVGKYEGKHSTFTDSNLSQTHPQRYMRVEGGVNSSVVVRSPSPADRSRLAITPSVAVAGNSAGQEVKKYSSTLLTSSSTYQLRTTGRGIGSLRIGRNFAAPSSAATAPVVGEVEDAKAASSRSSSSPQSGNTSAETLAPHKKRVTINRGQSSS